MTKIIQKDRENYQTKKKMKKITNVSTPEQESTTCACASFLYENREQHKLLYSEHADNRD